MRTNPNCWSCFDTGHVCEEHPTLPWDGVACWVFACGCGAAGMPCPECTKDVPQDGTHSIIEAFKPQ